MTVAAGSLAAAEVVEEWRLQTIFERIGMLSQRTYAAHAGQIIGVSRVVAALVLVLFAATGSGALSLGGPLDHALLLGFAGVAAASLIISFSNWPLDFALSDIFIGVDILVFTVLTASQTVLNADVAVALLCLLGHILFVSVLRWRSGFVFVVAVFLNTFWILDVVLYELPHGGVGRAAAARWCTLGLLETLVVLWASVHKVKAILSRFTGGAVEPGLPAAATAISYAMEMARATHASLCWIDPADRACYVLDTRRSEAEQVPVKLSFSAAEGFRHLAPMLYDAGRGRAIVSRAGDIAACTSSAVPARALLMELGVQTALCLPVDGDENRAWLILTGIPMLGWGHLHLADAICAEVTQGMAWRAAATHDLNSALFRLRRTVACDLHDSVAHSLAGAKFLLVALRSKVGDDQEITKAIDTIKDALDAEHLHVRRLIEQLRETDSDAHARNLIEDIEAVGRALAQRWQIEIELRDSDFRVQVPVWLSMEVQQIVREAISNGVRHGNASRVTMRCVRRAGMIEIEVTDNGKGFADPQAPALPRSISERLGDLGGHLAIEARSGATKLRMSIPSGVAD